MSAKKKWYLKKRHNPQLGIYYIREGRLSKAEAAKKCGGIYGFNEMLPFDTEEEYKAEIARIEATGGDKVQ